MLSRLLKFFAEKPKILLEVPYSEKDEDKNLGVRWKVKLATTLTDMERYNTT